jgi:hypothetical protein
MWICVYGVVRALCIGCIWMCSWPKNAYMVIANVLGITKLWSLCDLGMQDFGGFLKVVGTFVVSLVIK